MQNVAIFHTFWRIFQTDFQSNLEQFMGDEFQEKPQITLKQKLGK